MTEIPSKQTQNAHIIGIYCEDIIEVDGSTKKGTARIGSEPYYGKIYLFAAELDNGETHTIPCKVDLFKYPKILEKLLSPETEVSIRETRNVDETRQSLHNLRLDGLQHIVETHYALQINHPTIHPSPYTASIIKAEPKYSIETLNEFRQPESKLSITKDKIGNKIIRDTHLVYAP